MPEGRGRVSYIRDPAIATAAAKCWLSRWQGGKAMKRMVGVPTDSFHPTDCGFCDYPPERLIEAVSEFVEWGGLLPERFMTDPIVVRESIEMFLTLPSHEQLRLVQKAQGYDGGDADEDDR